MIENAISTQKTTKTTNVNTEVAKIQKWFKNEYAEKLAILNRDAYLGLPMRFSRYALEMEAYEKENRLRELLGQEKLPEPKYRNII
jgi:hypothetical protein